MTDLAPLIVPLLSFAAVALLVLFAGHAYALQARMQQRLPAPASFDIAATPSRGLRAFVARNFDEKRFGIDATRRDKLRMELVRAGYFGGQCVSYYLFAKAAAAISLPLAVYILAQFFSSGISPLAKIATITVALLIGYAAPDAYLSRRQRSLATRYRQAFPDLLDLLVVCIDAGMTIEGALHRVQNEIMKRCWELGKNIELMGAEMRAGRSMIEALDLLSGRLALDEVGSFVTMLRQSIELGSDMAGALRVFSEEMREKWLLRAEETANKLSVKMVIPLGLFIFPVVLLVIMLPVIIKLLAVLH
ncbi:MAG TPA: type II secretion system F family protein [Xanthobacteraceae bacterium]|nr:type II secretion system F family protein [Xanthobacteraceae bacterium]